MPIPNPVKSEKRTNFIDRCMGDKIMNKDFPDAGKRAGVCYTRWRNRNAKKSK